MKISKFLFLLLGIILISLPGCQKQYDIETNGGARLIYQADLSSIDTKDRSAVLDEDISIIAKRLDALEISNTVIQKENPDLIKIEMPQIGDVDTVVVLISRTAILEFGEQTTDDDPDAKWTIQAKKWKPALGSLNGQKVPLTSSYFLNNTYITNKSNGTPVLVFEWNKEGSMLSKEITIRLMHKPLGIFSGEKLISYPMVNAVIMDKGIIEGLNQEEATRLRDILNAGRLRVPLVLIDKQVKSPKTK